MSSTERAKLNRVLVLTGDGINCEQESARAFADVGAQVEIQHVNSILESHQGSDIFNQYGVICFPGGFSFGDELKSGKILAEKMREKILPQLLQGIQRGTRVIGICNGFQVLMQLGVFEPRGSLSLTTNDHGQFRDFWVECRVSPEAKKSPWFSMVSSDQLWLPVRHKEGRVRIFPEQAAKPTIALTYSSAINGSWNQAAALLDSTGRVLGLMPHPEAATQAFLNPLPMSEVMKQQNAQAMKMIFAGALR